MTVAPPPGTAKPETIRAWIPEMNSMRICVLLLLTIGILFPAITIAQDSKPIYDARLSPGSTKPSGAEEALWREKVLPAARHAWKEQEADQACDSDSKPSVLDVARGAFTKPGSDQRAILYRYCTTGHNLGLGGIAVVENNRVLAHVVFEGGAENAIGALPDINANGLAEILVASGGTNQGVTWRSISIFELPAGGAVTKFGRITVYSDSCGADEKKGKAEAQRISVKAGASPAFFREVFLNKDYCTGSGSWKKSNGPKPIIMEEDETDYQFIP